jgi:hypothetical protein
MASHDAHHHRFHVFDGSLSTIALPLAAKVAAMARRSLSN